LQIKEIKMKINKIFILGITASGKTTLAKKISKKTNLTHYGLDWIVYKKNWEIKHNEKTRDKKLKEIIKKKKWIIEGAYKDDWILPVIKNADLIILLQFPRHILMKRVFTRYIKNKINKKNRSKNNFKGMLGLLKYSYSYNNHNFSAHKNMTKRHKKEVIILKNKKQIKQFLGDLK